MQLSELLTEASNLWDVLFVNCGTVRWLVHLAFGHFRIGAAESRSTSATNGSESIVGRFMHGLFQKSPFRGFHLIALLHEWQNVPSALRMQLEREVGEED